MKQKNILTLILGIYSMLILCGTILLREKGAGAEAHLMPFWNMSFVLAGYKEPIADIILNVMIFIPMGFLCQFVVIPSQLCIPLCFLFSLCIESSQYCLECGCCETNDIINNTIGAVIGALAASIVKKITRHESIAHNNQLSQ